MSQKIEKYYLRIINSLIQSYDDQLFTTLSFKQFATFFSIFEIITI